MEEAVQLLPDDGRACSNVQDPKPLRSFLFDTQRAIELCRVCLAYYEDPIKNDPKRPWVEKTANRGSFHSYPWSTYTAEVWLTRRDRVMIMLIHNYFPLSIEYEEATSSFEANQGRRTKYRAVDLVFFLQAQMLLCAYSLMSEHDRRCLLCLPAHEGNPYVAREQLSISSEPIGMYSTRQLVDSWRFLCSRMNELQYDQYLLTYILQLEFRSAILLSYAQSALHHNEPDYREVVEEGSIGAGIDSTYKASEILLSTLTNASVAIHKHLIAVQYLPISSLEEMNIPSVRPEVSRALRKWFAEKARRQTTRMSSEWLRDRYVNLL
jgi:hypothetical protein